MQHNMTKRPKLFREAGTDWALIGLANALRGFPRGDRRLGVGKFGNQADVIQGVLNGQDSSGDLRISRLAGVFQ
jgi:hypothetical protein